MDRPYMNHSGDEVRGLINEHWGDFAQLGVVAYEIQFRQLIKEEQRAAVIERMVELGMQGRSEATNGPEFDFPTTDIVRNRRLATQALGTVDWRQYGLMSLSGYRVGRTRGEPTETRRKILNWLFLEDDLRDIDDVRYAAEWGAPKSADRLEKLANTLATFVRNAKRRDATTMNLAITEWSEDLQYLKETFYDNWGGFPWPQVGR